MTNKQKTNPISHTFATDQRFSMPIQCTDRTEETERCFPSALRAAADTPLPSGTACPEDRDLVESLAKLSVRFPPPADSEYDFLNSAPERPVGLSAPAKRPLSVAPCSPTDEETVDAPSAFVYPPSPSHCALSPPCCSSSSSSSLSHETVRGPQQVRTAVGREGRRRPGGKLTVCDWSLLMVW